MRVRRSRGNVFVGNLPVDFDDEQLAQTFDPYGIVLSATVARDPANGRRLRYGFVDIATERAAQAAIDALNGTAIDGHTIEVKISERQNASVKKPSRPPAGPGRPRPSAAAHTDEDHGGERAGRSFYAPQAPRKQPSFQVERRPLPRRFAPPH